MGVAGLVLCQPIGVAAWRIGNRVLREIDESDGQFTGRGQVQAGRLLGMAAVAVMVLVVSFVVLSYLARLAR